MKLAVTRRSNRFLLIGCRLELSQAGRTKASPRRNTAQAMRAFLAAMATTAFQYPRRCCNAIAQRLSLSVLFLVAANPARVPMTSKLRRSGSPVFVMRRQASQ